MKNIDFQSPGNLIEGDLDENDLLSFLLREYAKDSPKQPHPDTELVTEVIAGIQKLNKILEGMSLPEKKNFMSDWVTAEQVKLKLGISERTLFDWRKFGKLPFTRIENKFYYKNQDLENLLTKGCSRKKKESPEQHSV